MSEQSFFQNTLANFTHHVASGGAICHLTDLGYTVKQISDRLDFPTPVQRIRRQVWERLQETEVILTDEPGKSSREQASYVREYDKYGKPSFRRVVNTTANMPVINWRKLEVSYKDKEQIKSLLETKISENGEDGSYTACEFGLLAQREPQRFQEMLQMLEGTQREYVEGLPWETKWVYHRLNPRMMNILLRLSAEGLWRGDCYFLNTQERVHLYPAETVPAETQVL